MAGVHFWWGSLNQGAIWPRLVCHALEQWSRTRKDHSYQLLLMGEPLARAGHTNEIGDAVRPDRTIMFDRPPLRRLRVEWLLRRSEEWALILEDGPQGAI